MQILDAAQECFSRAGFHGATMDDVVRASGLSKGSLYWHFTSKEEVLLALFDRYVEATFAAWEFAASRSTAASPTDLLLESAESCMTILVEQRDLAQTWIGFLENPAARERMALLYVRSRAAVVALLDEGVAQGAFAPHDSDAIAAGLTGLCEGLFLQGIVDPEFDPIPPLRVSTHALLKGISR